MHSTDALRGGSFELRVDGTAVSHADYFRDFSERDRLAVLAPGRIDGAGAVNLIMAHVTAFYDLYRAAGDDFFAYPDFFALYRDGGSPPAYGMLDIHPDHKVARVGPGPLDALRAVTDRGVGILLVPDGEPHDTWVTANGKLERLALASARRTVRACYAYAFDGEVRNADVTITCDAQPFVDWLKPLFNSVSDDAAAMSRGRAWLDRVDAGGRLTQSYRRLSLDEALARL